MVFWLELTFLSVFLFFSVCFINAGSIISRKFKCLFSLTLFWILFPIYNFLCH